MTAKGRESTAGRTVVQTTALAMSAALGLGLAGPAFAQIGGLVGPRAALTAPLLPTTQAAAVPAATTPPTIGATAIASAAVVEQNGDTARLVFDLSAPVEVSAFALAAPDRVVVDLPEVDFRLDPQTGKLAARKGPARSRGLISSFRFGLLAPGKSRVVIDLAGPARIVRAFSRPASAQDPARLVIELAKTDPAAFRALVRGRALTAAAEPAAPTATPPALGAMGKPVIVIDPGHGGVDSGAMVNGLVEKFVVFDFAKALAAKLQATGKFKIVLTRDQDVFIPLEQRVRIAQQSDAALLVSIHADTVSDASDVAGATIYTLSDRASDAEAARVADKENEADTAAGVDGQQAANGISDILFDLTRRETRAFSHVFARTLINYWHVAGRLNKNPQRAAGFRVLMAPDVPSVLLELGYLSNSRDSAALTSPEWRDKTSSQVAGAIERFFATREAARPEAAAPAAIPTGAIGIAAPARHAGATVVSDNATLHGAPADVAPASQARDKGYAGR